MPKTDDPAFDDEFLRGAAYTEPSARERARRPGPLARLRARRAEKKRRRAMVEQWRSPEYRRKPWAAIAQVTVGVLVLSLAGGGLWWWNGRLQTAALDGGPVTGAGGTPALDPADPFAGSPAEGYANGEAGIGMPRPVAMKGLSKDDMALAYVHIQRMIVAANLDAGTLYKGKPDALAPLLQPAQRRDFTRNLDRKGDLDSRSWLTSFAPRTAEPATETIKVRGTVTARPAVDRGRPEVRVRTDHLFVYAVRPPGGGPAGTTRVVVRRISEISVYKEGPAVKFWLVNSSYSAAPSACDVQDGYVHVEYPGTGTEAAPTGPAVDPYDQSRRPAGKPGCRRASRT